MSDTPRPGFYLTRLCRGGPMVPVEVYQDPRFEAGFGAFAGGSQIDVFKVWPYCAREPVDKAEYDYRLALLLHHESTGEWHRYRPLDPNQIKAVF